MHKVDQTKFGSPEGNCTEACFASVLGIGLEEVPILALHPTRWYEVLTDWLAGRGFGLIRIYLSEDTFVRIQDSTPVLAAGKGPRGLRHMIVCSSPLGEHDPHPSRKGLLETDAYYIVVPLNLSKV